MPEWIWILVGIVGALVALYFIGATVGMLFILKVWRKIDKDW